MRRRKYKNPRVEGPIAEMERNGYECHTRGWPKCLLTKPGEQVIAVWIGSQTKGHHPNNPLVGYSKTQQKMILLFEKMGAKTLRVRPG